MALAGAFGDALALKYDDDPADPRSIRNMDPARGVAQLFPPPDGAACIHGHYHPGRYKIEKDDFLFSLIRPPVENLLSIYFFWKRLPPQGSALHDYFLREQLDIRATARLPLLRNLYSVSYFGGFDMSRFNIMGDYRQRDASIAKLSQIIGHPLHSEDRVNVTPPSEERQAAEADEKLKADLREILSADMRFFETYAEGR